jgi:hypothetical protein
MISESGAFCLSERQSLPPARKARGYRVINSIEGTGPIRTPTPVRRVVKTTESSESFSTHLDAPEETESTSAASATEMGLVDGVIGLQEVDDAATRASRGKVRAESILSELDDLRLDLLTGALSREKLYRLVRLVKTRRASVSDDNLSEILDEIDLRAQVELAKYTS